MPSYGRCARWPRAGRVLCRYFVSRGRSRLGKITHGLRLSCFVCFAPVPPTARLERDVVLEIVELAAGLGRRGTRGALGCSGARIPPGIALASAIRAAHALARAQHL